MPEAKWPVRLWLARHGQSAGNVARDAAEASAQLLIDIADRDVDVPLSALGQLQAGAMGGWFRALPLQPNVILFSPYMRARQTAEAVLALLDRDSLCAVVADERLREKEFGILDRLTSHGIRERYPELSAQRQHVGKFYFRPPGGESWCDVILRLRSVLDTICRDYCGERVLIVAHQVIVNCLRYLLEDLDEAAILPGALLLAANAAMRAGAGKLTMATGASISAPVGLALPEARVIGLAETKRGGLRANRLTILGEACRQADAILIGPGMQDSAATAKLVLAIHAEAPQTALILDAEAMKLVRHEHAPFSAPVLLTPHAGEMAALTGTDKQMVIDDPQSVAADAAQRWQAIVALKGALTIVASPAGQLWRHAGGNGGRGVSGSGDVLAGVIAGLAARGAPLEQAAVWGVALHALAGEQLALLHGPLGYLSREISAQIPALLRLLTAH